MDSRPVLGEKAGVNLGSPEIRARKADYCSLSPLGERLLQGTHKLGFPSLSSRELKVSPHIMRWRQGKRAVTLCHGRAFASFLSATGEHVAGRPEAGREGHPNSITLQKSG